MSNVFIEELTKMGAASLMGRNKRPLIVQSLNKVLKVLLLRVLFKRKKAIGDAVKHRVKKAIKEKRK